MQYFYGNIHIRYKSRIKKVYFEILLLLATLLCMVTKPKRYLFISPQYGKYLAYSCVKE
jgi:hypothetical protein